MKKGHIEIDGEYFEDYIQRFKDIRYIKKEIARLELSIAMLKLKNSEINPIVKAAMVNALCIRAKTIMREPILPPKGSIGGLAH